MNGNNASMDDWKTFDTDNEREITRRILRGRPVPDNAHTRSIFELDNGH